MARAAHRLIAAKGKKVTTLDLQTAPPADDVLAGLMLGPSLFGALFPEAFAAVFKPQFPGVDPLLTQAAYPKIPGIPQTMLPANQLADSTDKPNSHIN